MSAFTPLLGQSGHQVLHLALLSHAALASKGLRLSREIVAWDARPR